MKCFCRRDPCIHRIKAYENYKLIYTKDGYFEVVYAPKICVNQRITKVENEKNMVRVIIKVFNYEKDWFENISLINEISPKPNNIVVNNIDGLWCIDNNKIVVNYPRICELSVNTIDYLLCFDNDCSIESIVYIKDNRSENLDIKNIQKCITTFKL